MKKFIVFLICLALIGCDENRNRSSDTIQQKQQEKILAEGTSAIGMPAIKNFREKRIMKDIYEMRDQTGLVTYTYQWSEVTGKRVFLCNSIGYPIPAATQFTNPQKVVTYRGEEGTSVNLSYEVIPQADPNGLFSPSSAEGSWVMCSGPDGAARPVYSEPRLITSQFKLSE